MIIYVLGTVFKLEGFFLLIPVLCSLLYREQEGLPFLITGVISLGIGFLASFRKPDNHAFFLREGCVTTALSWILLSVVGSVPFVLTGEIPSFLNALFETVSGFTTTGASILTDVESMSHTALLWRSFTHWIGGMGVLVFLLAVIPLTGGGTINLMRAESPGPSVGKLVPKVKSTARILYLIYFGMTVTEIVLLLLAGMPVFDAFTLSFGTAGTGGFGVLNSSIGGYTPLMQWIITIFMILFGVNFNAYYFILFYHFKKALEMEEVRWYLGIIAASAAAIFFNIRHLYGSVFEALTHAAFQVGSIITTTGYSTTDFDLWPTFSKVILVLLMFIGACAGSTGGGFKVSRLVILCKTLKKEIISYIHPKSIVKIKMDGAPIEHDVLRSTNVYFITFILIFSGSVLLVSLENQDLVTTFTAVAATFNNIGPGLSMVGPTQNFGHFGVFTKYVLMFDMLAGRLELFPLLIFFHPGIWKQAFVERRFRRRV